MHTGLRTGACKAMPSLSRTSHGQCRRSTHCPETAACNSCAGSPCVALWLICHARQTDNGRRTQDQTVTTMKNNFLHLAVCRACQLQGLPDAQGDGQRRRQREGAQPPGSEQLDGERICSRQWWSNLAWSTGRTKRVAPLPLLVATSLTGRACHSATFICRILKSAIMRVDGPLLLASPHQMLMCVSRPRRTCLGLGRRR
jgi:hypothetical protein